MNKKDISKRYKYLTIVTLIVFILGTGSIALALNIPRNSEIPIVENNQIVFNGKVLTSTSNEKMLPSLSPENSRIAYVSKNGTSIFDDINILDLNTGITKTLNLENIFYTSALSLNWIDSNRVAFQGHVNPSLDAYALIDAENAKLIRKYNGTGFKWDKSQLHLYYTLSSPYFSQAKGKDKIMKDIDEVLYETDTKTEIVGGVGVSDDNQLAFFQRDVESKDVNLILAGKNVDNKVEVLKKVKWEDMTGNISFNLDNTISIDSKLFKTRFDITNQKIIEKK